MLNKSIPGRTAWLQR